MREQHNKINPVLHALLRREVDEAIPKLWRFEDQLLQEQRTTFIRSRT